MDKLIKTLTIISLLTLSFHSTNAQDKLSGSFDVKLNGFVGNKMNASYDNRILAQDADRLIEPFKIREEHSCWQSEFWGKWFTSAVLAYKYNPTPELAEKLKKAVYGLIDTQTEDGYIGNYSPESRLKAWDIWGRKYCMLGLIAYYDITNDEKALESAAKEADFLIKELNDKNAKIVLMGNHRGMAASSVLEPICQLYTRTGNKEYLNFAEEIVRQWETPKGPQLISKADIPVSERFPKPSDNWYGWEQGQKAYEMMSCYEGLLELYRITGKEEYKEAVEKTWQSITDNEINIAGSGSAMEAWFSGKAKQTMPIAHYQETCVTVTWIKFNQQLLRLTGEAKYADEIEKTFYNALLGAMKPDGSDWAKYTPLSGQRLEGSEQCGMGLNCCNASGPRGLFTIPKTAIMQSEEGVYINFYIDGSYKLNSPGNQTFVINQITDYPASGKIDLRIDLEDKENMEIALRIPSWSTNYRVFVNDVIEYKTGDISPGSYLKLNREWENSDRISIEFEMNGIVHRFGNSPEYIAITRGPIVLSRDERISKTSLEAILTPVINEKGYIDLTEEVSSDPELQMIFSANFIPESYTEQGSQPIKVNLCDYASAGNSTSSFPFFKVWLPQLYNPRNQD
ncbi:MAG: glycoside hydrolase family 127 protein [Fermentimonas sp.]|nr:glycoside hydrolase family 127 protein [Fermentimonas sp.]